MAQLTFIAGEFTGQTCPLAEGKTTVGRGLAHNLVIEHAGVSGDHCEILVHGPEVIVRDHHSKNGSWIDGKRIQAQAPVKHGQTIRFGSVEAILSLPKIDYEHSSTISAVHLHWRYLRKRSASQTAVTGGKRILQAKPRFVMATRTALAESNAAKVPSQTPKASHAPDPSLLEPTSRYWLAMCIVGSIFFALFLLQKAWH